MAYDITTVNRILRDNNSYVLHVSTIGKVEPDDGRPLLFYPNDLDYVINNNDSEISCCAMPLSMTTSYDIMALGSVAVILRLKSNSSLLAVHYSDMGSTAEHGGKRREFLPKYIPKSDGQIIESITNRKKFARDEDGAAITQYNEWVVTDHKACAIVMLRDPAEVRPDARGSIHVNRQDIQNYFHKLPILGPFTGNYAVPEEFSTNILYK